MLDGKNQIAVKNNPLAGLGWDNLPIISSTEDETLAETSSSSGSGICIRCAYASSFLLDEKSKRLPRVLMSYIFNT